MIPLPSSQSALLRIFSPPDYTCKEDKWFCCRALWPTKYTWPEQTKCQVRSPISLGVAETHCSIHTSQVPGNFCEIAAEGSTPVPRKWHPHLRALYFMQPFNMLVSSWHFSRKAKDEIGQLFLLLKETLHYTGKIRQRGAGTGALLPSVPYHHMFGESVPSLSAYTCEEVERSF